MAYITPNSTVRFHQNIPLDNTYDHTLYFSSLNEQETYFSYRNQNDPSQSRVKYQLDNYSYQRHTRDSIRVGLPIENIVNCSYMSFKNTSFENKWFYAFITNLEYVNNNTTIVYYEIDVMQTYVINDVTFDQCYIERQHTVSDNIGDNTIPENLELGEYTYQDFGLLNTPGNEGCYLVIAATFSGSYDALEDSYTFTDAEGEYACGIYTGVHLNIFAYQNVGGWYYANKFLIDATNQNKSDGIVNVFMLPKDFFIVDPVTNAPVLTSDHAKQSSYPFVKGTSWTYNGHVCKNNKMYTYPFTLFHIDNGQGNCADYRWEFFNTNNAVLNVYYSGSSSPEMVVIPVNYNGVQYNYNEKLVINNFPQCAYAIDSYLAWLAQNNTKWNISMGGTIAGTVLGAAGFAGSLMANISDNIAGYLIEQHGISNEGYPGPRPIKNVGVGVGSLIAGGTKVLSLLAEKKVASTMPAQAKGSESNIANIAMDNFGYHTYNVHLRPEYAKIIDDYFTRYGYAIHQNAVPELCARTRFTYIKTVDCTINANMPNEYSQKIVSIMNNGITFWNDKQHIGNYEIANEVWPG